MSSLFVLLRFRTDIILGSEHIREISKINRDMVLYYFL